MSDVVKTTVIGSYPVEINVQDLASKYFNQEEFNWNKYILSAINDMQKAGIDTVSDGQTRDSFTNIFLRKLAGCRIRQRPEVYEKISYKQTITVDDIVYVKKNLEKDHNVIGLLAGPYTLMKSCVDLFYNNEKQLAFEISEALNKEALALQKHVDIISVDEPFFSVSYPDYAKELINNVLKNIKVTKRLHVCGDVGNIIADLLDLPVDILSHEFKASSSLLDKFKEYKINKKICLGSVRSDDLYIENVDEIKDHIKKAINIFDSKICQISPDCGLRLLPRDVAFQKLKNLVQAKVDIYG